jgi:hypothetical protein
LKKPMIVLALMLTVPLGLAACGGDDGKSDEDQVRDVIALANNKNPDVCDKLTDKWIKNVVGGDKGDCEKQVKQSPKDAVDIKKISFDGDKATVTAEIQGTTGTTVYLVKEDDEWKLDDIGQGK